MKVTGKPQSKTSYLEAPGSIHDHLYGFMVDKNDLRKICLLGIQLSTISINTRILHTHISFFPRQQCAIAVADNVFKLHTYIHTTGLLLLQIKYY